MIQGQDMRQMTTPTLVSTNGRLRAEITLQALLEADDIPAELERRKGQLDEHLLRLVQENAGQARRDGEIELADGLEELAEIISGFLEWIPA
jgi:hypothetical protein